MNQFNVAVAEKLAHLEHEEWARSRRQPKNELATRALALLDRAGSKPPETGDELPHDSGIRVGERNVLEV